MKVVTLNIPHITNTNSNEVAMRVASRLYNQEKLPAAKVARSAKRTLIRLLGKCNISLFDDPVSELEGDIAST